jgi:hypothetical protein
MELSMSVKALTKDEWQSFFDYLSRILVGSRVEIHVESLTLGDQLEAEWLPLLGMVYDKKNDIVEVALEGLTHMIHHPREISVSVEERTGAILSLQIIDGDDSQQIIMLREPLMLPPPDESRAGVPG